VFHFVCERIAQGMPPTVREVQEAMGFRAVQSAREHLEGLVAAGQLVKEPGRARGYGMPAASGSAGPVALVPLLGRVQAGALSLAVEDLEGYVPVAPGGPAARSGTGGLFALRVQGDSMVGAAILPGDLVLVRKQETARHGEIVVALVGEEATVKRLVIRDGRPELHAENPDYPPIVPEDSTELRILGKVVEVRRELEGRTAERRAGERRPPDGRGR
jgi:repressor LexA